jgi:DNA modification methylase
MAESTGRNSVLIEINPKYADMIGKQLKPALDTGVVNYRFEEVPTP